jgi:hypothetical protein
VKSYTSGALEMLTNKFQQSSSCTKGALPDSNVWNPLLFRLALSLTFYSLIAGQTIACYVCIVPYQSLLDRVESSAQVVVARIDSKQPSRWQIVRVIKSNSDLNIAQKEMLKDSEKINLKELQLLHRKTINEKWINEGRIDQEFVTFLIGAVELQRNRLILKGEDPKFKSLSYFLPFLEHQHLQIADSAFYKVSRTPYKNLRNLAKGLDPDQLLELIENSRVPKEKRSLYITLLGFCAQQKESIRLKEMIDQRWKSRNSGNLSALLAAHAEVNGETSIDFIEKSYFQNRDRKLDELIEAVDALRLLGQADETISGTRIRESYHLFLNERPQLLELIIEDITRWEDWSFAPILIELYKSRKQPWNNNVIMKYLKACPNPDVKQFVYQGVDS